MSKVSKFPYTKFFVYTDEGSWARIRVERVMEFLKNNFLHFFDFWIFYDAVGHSCRGGGKGFSSTRKIFV